MAIQQNVNQILSLSAVFTRMSPLADIAEHRKDVEKDMEKHKKDVEKAKKAYDQQSKVVEEAEKLNSKNQVFPRDEQLSAAKHLYQLEPTEELATNIRDIERNIRETQEKAAMNEAARSMRTEQKRQKADRAREQRLKILEGVQLSPASEAYTKKLLESNTPMGEPLKEKKPKEEEAK